MKDIEPYRIDFNHDKLGNRVGVNYYFKILQGHKKFINDMLKEFDISKDDRTMLLRLLRTNEYSEVDRDKLMELRSIYLHDI